MRVDAVPLHLLPLFHAYGYGVGALLNGIIATIRHSCRFERVHRVDVAGPRIECFWHEHLPAYFASYLPVRDGEQQAWMNHPLWYMRPVHVLLRWSGVTELALGSSGNSGRAALQQMVEFLRRGYSTAVAVDGPAGPMHVLKRGALDMALASGIPIVAIHFEYERAFRTPTWDKKAFPLPFSLVRVRESGPFYVEQENYQKQLTALEQRL